MLEAECTAVRVTSAHLVEVEVRAPRRTQLVPGEPGPDGEPHDTAVGTKAGLASHVRTSLSLLFLSHFGARAKLSFLFSNFLAPLYSMTMWAELAPFSSPSVDYFFGRSRWASAAGHAVSGATRAIVPS